MELPFLTSTIAPIGGAMRSEPDDFRVEEIPAYLPSGEGEHLYVTFEKRGRTTPEAVRALARALDVDPRGAGWAGLKDRHAVSVQTVSFHRGDAARAMDASVDGIRVLAAKRHGNKLRSGHLHGNRFEIRVRDCDPGALALAESVRAVLTARGVPNFYGQQRFGRDGDNAERARDWLLGRAPAPRDPTLRKLIVSSLQSELFNQYLAERLTDGLLDRYVTGDLAMRHPVGGPFPISADEAEVAYAQRTCSPSGPMFGASMRWPTDAALEREQRVLSASGVTLEAFARAKDLAEGTRRAVRMITDDLAIRELPAATAGREDLVLSFALPAGGYATAVLREFRKTDEESLKPTPMSGIETSVPV